MNNWSQRYAASRFDKCRLCGQSDDGSYQVVSKGVCKDTKECAENQQALKNQPEEQPVKKTRKKPLVDRQGMAACTHEDCLSGGKRYPAEDMSWENSAVGRPVCSDHWATRFNTIDYHSWKRQYKRK